MARNGDDYFLALGKFIHSFSVAEATLHYTFHYFAQIDQLTANIIKKESSSSSLTSLIKALIEVNDFPKDAASEAAYLLDHLEHISSFRHRVIHRGARLTEDGNYTATNWHTTKSLESLEIAKFQVTDIKNATMDLDCIALRLFDLHDGDEKDPRTPEHDAVINAPWRYKPVRLEKPNSPHPSKKSTRPRPQKSSRA